MKNFKLFLVFMLLMTGLIPVFGSSSAHFYAKLTTNSATGAGEIYVYRGGGDNLSPYDKLNMPSGGWKTLNSTSESFDAGVIEMSSSNHPDGYGYIDKTSSSGTNTKGALHMYFFARPFAGYQFDGWYDAAAGTGNSLKGSVDHYPFPAKQYVGAPVVAPGEPSDGGYKDYYGNFNGSNYHAKSGSTYRNWMSRWNNGTAGATPPGAGIWDGIHYLRHVEVINNGDDKDITKYAKFSIIPRKFVFVGTGFNDVSYTAGGTNVGASTKESGNITSNIALSITYDANKYNFVKWQWSVGQNGVKTDIATTASATYTFVVDRGYPTVDYTTTPRTYDDNYQRVYIWPVLQEKQDAEATVQIGGADPVPYEHWADAFAAAKADNVSGAIITLKKNITGITTIQEVDRNMTLNLNGFSITGSVNNMFTVSGTNTNFTLCDNTPAQAGRIVHNPADPGTTTYAIKVSTKDTLTLTSGGVTVTGVNNVANSAGSSRGVYIQSGAALKMSGGQISSQSTNNAYALVNEGKATISGGVCTAYAKGASSAKTGLTARAFYNTGASVTIDGGTFTASADSSTTVCGIQHNNSATMTINYAEVNVTVGKGNGAYDLYNSSAGKIKVYDGKYKGKYPSSVANKDQIEVQGGIYDSYLNLRSCTTEGFDCYELEQGSDYNAGYRFVVKGLEGNPNVCKLITLSGTTYYSSLADAFSYVQAHPNDLQSIVMTAFEYNFNTANNYTVPQQTAFVVPYGAGQTGAQTEPVDIQTWANLSKYHSLALGPGVNITVQGTFTVGGQQFGTSSSNPGPGSVVGSYAMLDMSAGGHLTIANGASLYAYGFIKGAGNQSTSGTITIQNGGTVYEDLVVNDMHGGGGTAACVNGTSGSNSYGLFPFSQYFIQNIEPRMTIEYGGVEKASYNIQSSQGGKKDMINVIGTGSDFLFQTSSGSTITKWYDATRDYQCYEVSGGMSMNGLTIDAGMASMSSSSFILPLNNNMDIHVKSGALLNLPYALKLQAGAKLTIDEGAVVNVNNDMYVYDYQDWDKYACGYAQTFGTTTSGKNIPWHTLRDVSSAAKLGNADVVVNGQLVIKGSGALYTTSHGANITSTGSGKIIFNVAGKSANKNLYECWSTYGKREDGNALAQGETNKAAGQVQVGSFNLLKTWYIFGTPVECNPAQLKNANGTFTSTSGAAANDVYQYCDGTWTKGGCVNYYTVTWNSEDGNSTLETDENVAENSATTFDGTAPEKAATAEYTYTFDGWATEPNGEKVYDIGETPAATDNATYYAHFSSSKNSYTITWLNDDDSQIDQTTVEYGVVPTHADATKANTAEYTYTFTGWDNTPVAVTGEATYKATYSSSKNSYEITWLNDDNSLINKTTVEYGVVPTHADATKDNTAEYTYTFNGWSPAISAVTGAATYTAQFNSTVNTYAITWKNSNGEILKTDENVPYGTTPSYNGTPISPSDGLQYTYPFVAWSPMVVSVTGDAEYTATYGEQQLQEYPVKWKNWNGDVVYETTKNYGWPIPDIPEYVGTPVRPKDGNKIYTFAAWSAPVSNVDGCDVTYTALYSLSIDVQESTEPTMITIPTNEQVVTTTVDVKGKLEVDPDATLTTDDLILEGTPTSSGEITGQGSVTATQHAYYDLTKEGGFKAKTWYSVAVPWEVDVPAYDKAKNGVYVKEAGGDFEQQELGRSYDLIYYDGQRRADAGHSDACWKYVEDDDAAKQIMYPGHAYMIYFLKDIETIRFERKEGAALKTTTLAVEAYGVGSTDSKDAGWNGIANPSTFHAFINPNTLSENTYGGVNFGQLYDGDTWTYTPVNLNTSPLVVGQPVYVQVAFSNSSIEAFVNHDGAFHAPRSVNKMPVVHCEVGIAASEGKETDRVIVRMLEDKEDAYVIAQDLTKMGVSTTVPQMWVARYDSRLCINTAAPSNNRADYPLGISVPQNGYYVISLDELQDENVTLYLTYNGRAIWNLNYGAYEVELQRGTNTNYGLRAVVYKTPQVTTGVEETTIENGEAIRKVMVDDQVYIIRNGEIYSITGQKAK